MKYKNKNLIIWWYKNSIFHFRTNRRRFAKIVEYENKSVKSLLEFIIAKHSIPKYVQMSLF